MRVLFSHQNFPAQFKHFAPALAAAGHEVVYLSRPSALSLPGVRRVDYAPHREAHESTHHYIRPLETAVLYGQAAARAAQSLREQGFYPDVMIAHPGWGESLFFKDVFPRAPLVNYFEFFYRASGSDFDFAREAPAGLDEVAQLRMKNTTQLVALESTDWGISPTRWQKQQYPAEYQSRISVIHEGIDTRAVRPHPEWDLDLPSGARLTRADEVVTYVGRSLEPYRGFPTFMRAAERILRRRPDCQIVVVGSDDVSYGRKLPDGETYRQRMLKEVAIDPARIHFLGRVPYPTFLRVLNVSSVHCYLSYPFIVSWSMVEAMAMECLVVGSDTLPVAEVIEHGRNGLLADFFDHDAFASQVCEALEAPDRFAALKQAARATVLQAYDLRFCLAEQMALIATLAEGRRPPVQPILTRQHQPPRRRPAAIAAK